MSLEYGDFIHPSDKKALAALKAIPAFDLVLKKFMSVVGEKMFKIETTSSCLKLGEEQMPEIYAILVRVCDKLQIEVPELYLALDRAPNACTYGDTDVFIVLNSGLLETLTPEQIETVIAHECGHIVCHHVLYSTMANFFSPVPSSSETVFCRRRSLPLCNTLSLIGGGAVNFPPTASPPSITAPPHLSSTQ